MSGAQRFCPGCCGACVGELGRSVDASPNAGVQLAVLAWAERSGFRILALVELERLAPSFLGHVAVAALRSWDDGLEAMAAELRRLAGEMEKAGR